MHYNRFRYYDNGTGQYLSPDPIGLSGGVNPYGYVHNPLGWVDPLGLVCVCPLFDSKQLQKKFKHAIDFGVSGNANKAGLEAFENAMRRHINLPSTSAVKGTYRWKQDVYHHYDPNTNLDVMTDMDGNFISGWKLSERQVADLEGGGNVF